MSQTWVKDLVSCCILTTCPQCHFYNLSSPPLLVYRSILLLTWGTATFKYSTPLQRIAVFWRKLAYSTTKHDDNVHQQYEMGVSTKNVKFYISFFKQNIPFSKKTSIHNYLYILPGLARLHHIVPASEDFQMV